MLSSSLSPASLLKSSLSNILLSFFLISTLTSISNKNNNNHGFFAHAQKITTENLPYCPSGKSSCKVRTYYIAADEVDWDYAPSGYDHIDGVPLAESGAFTWTVRYTNRIGAIYKKAIFNEYTDDSFTEKKVKPDHLGILGPVIRAEVGDIVKVVYKNQASLPYGIHSHGVLYEKESEGSTYHNLNDAMKGAAVEPGETFTYTWVVGDRAGPGPADGNATLWAYHSHFNEPGDMYVGLYGAIVVYRPGLLDNQTHLPVDVDKEFFLHFMVFDENNSHYLRDSILKFAPELKDRVPSDPSMPFTMSGETWVESNLMHAINGRMFGNLNGLDMKLNEKVRWFLMGFGNEVDLHTAHWHSQTVLLNGHRTDVVELLPATFRTVETVADTPGTWLLHCHVVDHQIAGMDALYRVTPLLSSTSGINKTISINNNSSINATGSDNTTSTEKEAMFEPMTLSKELASKTAMNAPAAPKPPKAAPIYGLNHSSRSMEILTYFNVMIIFLTIMIMDF